ncbi:hypothetical protein ACIBSV_49395 [Embleya sp. NPDC050154]|uniref:hypothetical protein n=1 Tax=unclassified Embleya TaxID=2699296 RepID=UPI0037B220CB
MHRRRFLPPALAFVTSALLLATAAAAPAGAADAVPADDGPRTACLVITKQGGGHPTIFDRWADVRNDCGRHIDRVTVQLDYHFDPACQALAAGGSTRYHWISTLQENVEANYAYECPGP